jgi:hypothetical protein
MKNQEISRQHQKLSALIDKIDVVCGTDIELQAHWAKYICVLSAGLLENSLYEVYGEYVRSSSSPYVASFCEKNLSKIRNPNTARFLEIAGKFKASWRVDLEVYLDDDGKGDAMNSIMSNRHLIAHGENSGITLARVKEYLFKSMQVIEFIEQQCES